MIGRKLTAAACDGRHAQGQPIEQLTLLDVVPPPKPARFAGAIETRARGSRRPRRSGASRRATAAMRSSILPALSPAKPELDFEKGYRVNLDGMRALLEAIRAMATAIGRSLCTRPRLQFSARRFRRSIPDDFHLTPLTSYGTQKAMGELLLADYTRRGFCDGVGIRLPSVVVRPGKPNKAASGFFSGIIREPLAGMEAMLPVPDTVGAYPCQPARCGRFPYSRGGACTRCAWHTHQSFHARRVLHGRRADCRIATHRRRSRGRAHPA